MKYYLYISEKKINMLFSQLPKSFTRKITDEIKFRASIFRASVEARIGEKTNPQFSNFTELLSRLKSIERFLHDEDLIGDVDQPKSYIEGIHHMHWGVKNVNGLEFVFFGGGTLKSLFGFGGSCRHLVSNMQDVKTRGGKGKLGNRPKTLGGTSHTYTMVFFKHGNPHAPFRLGAFSLDEVPYNHLEELRITNDAIKEDLIELVSTTHNSPESDYYEVARTIAELAVQPGSMPPQKMQFLAKSLIEGECYANNSKRRVILGTPIYVAIAD